MCPSLIAARVQVALTGNAVGTIPLAATRPRILPVSRATFSSSPGM